MSKKWLEGYDLVALHKLRFELSNECGSCVKWSRGNDCPQGHPASGSKICDQFVMSHYMVNIIEIIEEKIKGN